MSQAHTLITGGAGFVGSNLADTLLRAGRRVVLLDNLSRPGVVQNAEWLKHRHDGQVGLVVGDITDAELVTRLVEEASEVYHLAAQVAVTTSLEDPRHDLTTNLVGTFNVLDAARRRRKPPAVLFTSTNKIYGSLSDVAVERAAGRYRFSDGRRGIDERAPLDFHSPYGCSKGAADQYVRDYARIFDVPTVVFRMSCIYGTRQWGTEDQGWVAHFGRAILAGEPITIYGDGCQVRDILWIDDLVEAMRTAMGNLDTSSGEIFNVGGGPERAVSVGDVAEQLMELSGRDVPVHREGWRAGDQRIYVSDISRIRDTLGWKPRVGVEQGLERLLEWLDEAGSTPASPGARTRTSLPAAS